METGGSKAVETGGSKSARTRMRILNAAAHVLSRKGYAGTRLSDVADQAQLQAPAIYYYFPSREALVEEVMWTGIWLMREHVGQVLVELPPSTGPMERIDAAVAAHLRYALDISDYTTAAIRNAGQVPDDIRIRYSAEAAKYEPCGGPVSEQHHGRGGRRGSGISFVHDAAPGCGHSGAHIRATQGWRHVSRRRLDGGGVGGRRKDQRNSIGGG